MTHYDVEPLEGMHPELGLLMSSLADGTREWRENLGDLPVEALTWQPFPNGHSIGALILHMTACETWWIERMSMGLAGDPEDVAIAFDEGIDQDGIMWPTPPAQPLLWYLDIQDKNRTKMNELVRQHGNPTSVHGGARSTYTFRWALAHLVEHDSYHGGQAVLISELWRRSQ